MSLQTSIPQKAKFWKEDRVPDEVETPPESLIVTGTAILAGVATRKALMALWKQVRGDEPPTNPAAPDVGWTDALIWAASVGTAVGVSRVLSRRGVTAAARKWSQ